MRYQKCKNKLVAVKMMIPYLTIATCCSVMISNFAESAYLPVQLPTELQLPQQLHYYNHPVVYQLSSYLYKLDPRAPLPSGMIAVEDLSAEREETESDSETKHPAVDPNRFAVIDAPAACRPGEATDGRGKCKKIANIF